MGLKFNTAKSIYKPLEIEVDGKVYQCQKITKDFLEKLLSYEEMALKGNLLAPYEQANFAFSIPIKILSKLDAAEVRDINNYVTEGITNAEKAEAETKGPNLGGPGGSK